MNYVRFELVWIEGSVVDSDRWILLQYYTILFKDFEDLLGSLKPMLMDT